MPEPSLCVSCTLRPNQQRLRGGIEMSREGLCFEAVPRHPCEGSTSASATSASAKRTLNSSFDRTEDNGRLADRKGEPPPNRCAAILGDEGDDQASTDPDILPHAQKDAVHATRHVRIKRFLLGIKRFFLVMARFRTSSRHMMLL